MPDTSERLPLITQRIGHSSSMGVSQVRHALEHLQRPGGQAVVAQPSDAGRHHDHFKCAWPFHAAPIAEASRRSERFRIGPMSDCGGMVCTKPRWPLQSSQNCCTAFQKFDAPSSIARLGSISRPRDLQAISYSFHDCALGTHKSAGHDPAAEMTQSVLQQKLARIPCRFVGRVSG